MLGGWSAGLLGVVAGVIAARALGPGGYGTVVLALAVSGLVARLLDFTLTEAVVHHGHRALAVGDLAGLRALLRLSFRLDIVVGLIVASASMVLAGPLAQLASANGIDPDLVRIAALEQLAITANGPAAAVLLLANRPDLNAWATAGGSLFRALGVLVAVILWGGVEAVMISYVVAGAASSLLLGIVAWRVAWRGWASAPRGPTPVGTRELLRFGAHTSASTSIEAVGQSVFPAVLGNLAGTGAVGIFKVAQLPIQAALTASGPLRLMILPEQARLFASGRISELRRAMVGYTLICFAIALPVAVAGWFLMPLLIETLFSSAYDAAVWPARILLVAAVVQFPFSWTKSFHAAVGRPHIRTRLTALYVIVSVSLVALLGDRGAEGAAIAWMIATVTTVIVWVNVAWTWVKNEEAAVGTEEKLEEELLREAREASAAWERVELDLDLAETGVGAPGRRS
jgi:O-antigen/teichoic acid export membrane protein